MQISRVSSLFRSSIVSYLGSGLGLVLDTELVLDLGLGSLSILFIVGLVCFFSTRVFLISAIITVKIIYLGFLASYTSGVAPII